MGWLRGRRHLNQGLKADNEPAKQRAGHRIPSTKKAAKTKASRVEDKGLQVRGGGRLNGWQGGERGRLASSGNGTLRGPRHIMDQAHSHPHTALQIPGH